jgi:uncharacterized membrane protein
MLYTIAVASLILWILAILGGYLLGGLINILLAFAIIMVLIDVFRKRVANQRAKRLAAMASRANKTTCL